MNKRNNINNKVKNRQKPFDWSKLISGCIWWIITTMIITSFISLTCDSNIIDFLYPKTENINIESNNILKNPFTNLIKEINNKIFVDCNYLNSESGEKSNLQEKLGRGVSVTGANGRGFNSSNNYSNSVISKFLNFFLKFEIINQDDMEYFSKYLKEYNCELIKETLLFQNKIINIVLNIFKEDKNDNFRNISKIIISPIMFVLKPIIVFILGYSKFFYKIIELILDDKKTKKYDIFIRFIFSIINGTIINLFVIFPIFIIKIIIHIFTFTLLPLFIMKNNCHSNVINIINKQGMKPFLGLMFILFNIPFFIYLINYIQL